MLQSCNHCASDFQIPKLIFGYGLFEFEIHSEFMIHGFVPNHYLQAYFHPTTWNLWKEKEREALADREEVVEEEPAQPAADERDSDESSDEFGMVKRELPDPSAKVEKGDKTDRKSASAKAKPTDSTTKKTSDGKAAKVMSQAKTILGALEAITPLAYWQRTVKPKDSEAKIEKAFDLATALAEMPDDEAKALGKELQTKGEATLNSIETLNLVPTQDSEAGPGSVMEKVSKFEAGNLDKLCLLPADCLNAVLSDVGRKLLEQHVLGNRILPFFVSCHVISSNFCSQL